MVNESESFGVKGALINKRVFTHSGLCGSHSNSGSMGTPQYQSMLYDHLTSFGILVSCVLRHGPTMARDPGPRLILYSALIRSRLE
ncbi:hypothetical protein TNCV_1638181 [Trichonephila clavipes]|nr:hypothetical protein TNCV_1638181 [Trichonephila clavipes]